jgi:type IV secretion system protein VirB9
MKKTLTALVTALSLFSCRTVDIDKRVSKLPGDSAPKGPVILTVPLDSGPPPVEVIERPVYVPQPDAAPSKPPAKGRTAVEESGRHIVSPEEYSRSAFVYDYHPDLVYEVYTQPLRVTDIRLEPGEKAVEMPFFSDSERWMPGAGVSYENGEAVQHIYVKPVEHSLSATLIINTDRRVYHLVLRSYQTVFMPMVRWRYPSTGLPNNYIKAPGSAGDQSPEAARVDPRFLSFNYRLTCGLFRKPVWFPELVYDDGQKTYISFPPDVLQKELPAVFEERANVVNYRVAGNLVIIDKLITKITVKLANREIIIEKKRG